MDIRRKPRLHARPMQALTILHRSLFRSTSLRPHRWRDAGATGIEYALVACFIALAIVIGVTAAGNGLNKVFATIGNQIIAAADTAQQSSN